MPESDLALLIRAARAAGEVALRYHGPTAKRWDKPGGAGPVTEADLAVNEALKAVLLDARPDYGWLSEEDADTPERLGRPRIFLLDPIDGTSGFIEGSSSWSLSLAIVTEGEISAAVVHLPADEGKLYAAAAGEGATLDGQPIRAAARESVEGAQVLATRYAMEPKHWPGGVPGFKRHHRPSLAYRLALVAEGRFDGMLTLRDSWDWDIAAGLLICREAGAVVTDREGNAPRFNTEPAKTRGVVAGGPAVHAGLIAAMRPRG
ncbi:3'(2'),5'-bisphosphate nucleotidase CysQ [Rhodosalinus halophilus]|uniref:3'(2'),5'-bisphosphate nucleotidase CysQ n=1 Tax=Rhodosalinus halophilus TaxID=2259333 RepID=A0A365U8L0_9RHOB|nr:3'(2'),5'-bisphosphate nucleotidase CysQ [Rhodosalinus halophilus]RBI84804.1 3'(2'),5'-bisphosphate nucleotidase CysQ [Rhodosalinus halophilus]